MKMPIILNLNAVRIEGVDRYSGLLPDDRRDICLGCANIAAQLPWKMIFTCSFVAQCTNLSL
jgi:hypothetical protein